MMPKISFKSHLQYWLITFFTLAVYWGVVEATGFLFSTYGLLPAPIWPAASVAFLSVWLWGRKAWLGIFIGATLANWLYPPEQPPLWMAMMVAFGSLLAVVIANRILKRFCGTQAPFNQLNSVLIFLSVGGILQALIAATIGMSAVYMALGTPDGGLFNAWLKWAIADAAGVLFFAPLIMVWLRPPKTVNVHSSTLELALVFIVLTTLVVSIYWLAKPDTYAIYALPFLIIGPLAWAALRFSIQHTVALLLWKELLAFWGTVLGFGVLNASGDPYPIGTLGIMLVSTAIGTHVVNALVSELRLQKQALELSNEDLEMRVAERTANLVASEARMRLLASTDELTGLANRRHFWGQFEKEVLLANRRNKPLCFAMIDIDHFKEVNDNFGHLAGDEALKTLAQLMRDHLDEPQFVGRLGGEEFGIILPRVEMNDALAKLEDLRQRLSKIALKLEDKDLPSLTISIGLTLRQAEDTTDHLFARADQALYKAKQNGRNRTEIG